MAERKSDFSLAMFDDLFSSEAERSEERSKKIRDIPLTEIDDFPDHPYKIRDDEDMIQLIESVSERGVITPAMVRKKEDGRYELISGHRRKRACELVGYETLPCEVVELTKEEAIILMVESNCQRSQILPSEKAFAYKMRNDAIKRQGKRNDLTSSPLGIKLNRMHSLDKIGEDTGDSRNQVHRYIRLTNLVPELLEFVDEGRMKMRQAVEISYLDEDSQRDLVDAIDMNDAIPSHAQAIRIRKLFDEGKLTTEIIDEIMEEAKPNQKEKPLFQDSRIAERIPKSLPRAKHNDYVVTALDFYNKHLQRERARERASDRDSR